MNIVTEIAGIIGVLVPLYVKLQQIYGGKPIQQVLDEARADNNAVLNKT